MINYKDISSKLSEISPSFCLAKWLQLSLHLERGTGHSCHHPPEHHIPMEELLKFPNLLHNTSVKIKERQSMVKGEKPLACEFCWRAENNLLEDSTPSDRLIKSSREWALPYFNYVKENLDKNINPTYVEVSFSSTCQLKCAYCGPHNSSAWQSELDLKGNYPSRHFPLLDKNFDSKDYVDAFWKWWPDLSSSLKIFRITGGEPLLSKQTWLVLEDLMNSPRPEMELVLNTNLSIDKKNVEKFVGFIHRLTNNKSIKCFKLITSLESIDRASEYIRFGIDNNLFWENLKYVCLKIPESDISITSTVQFMSADSFISFIKKFISFRNEYALSNLFFDPTPIKHPEFLCIENLPSAEKDLFKFELLQLITEYEKDLSLFEVLRLKSIINILNISPDIFKMKEHHKAFFCYFSEYDLRRKTNFQATFPRLQKFWVESSKLV